MNRKNAVISVVAGILLVIGVAYFRLQSIEEREHPQSRDISSILDENPLRILEDQAIRMDDYQMGFVLGNKLVLTVNLIKEKFIKNQVTPDEYAMFVDACLPLTENALNTSEFSEELVNEYNRAVSEILGDDYVIPLEEKNFLGFSDGATYILILEMINLPNSVNEEFYNQCNKNAINVLRDLTHENAVIFFKWVEENLKENPQEVI